MRAVGPLLVALGFILGGCANPYQDFYRGPTDAHTIPGYLPPAGEPTVLQVADLEKAVRRYAEKGFVVLGSSSFVGSGSGADERSLQNFSKKVGAEIALLSTAYKGSHTAQVPMTLPSSNTSYSTGSATAYGPGGPVTAFGNSTTTTYGTTTTYIPMTVHESQYDAVFLVKRNWRFGVQLKPVPDSMRQAMERNGGALVDVVVEDTPAYAANILPGDILLALNDKRLTKAEDFNALAATLPAGVVNVLVWRSGRELTLPVSLAVP